MPLKAREYPDVWVFSNDCPSPPKDSGWVEDKVRIRTFIETFFMPQFFGRIVLWRHPSYAGADYFIDTSTSDYRVINYLPEAEQLRFGIEDLALSGHLSVFFVPLSTESFREKILSYGHYGKPQDIIMGSQDLNDPLDWKHGQDVALLESDTFRSGHRIFAFSHDAEFLYEIFR